VTAVLFSIRAVSGLDAPPMIATMRQGAGEIVAILSIVFGVLGLVVWPLARAIASRIERGGRNPVPALSPDAAERFDRLERAVEAIAVEVERISEGQRFVTKLMAERAQSSTLLPPQR
jgi:hypothetical protein